MLNRCYINVSVMLAYVGFWHITLYWYGHWYITLYWYGYQNQINTIYNKNSTNTIRIVLIQ
jgi:hypothetical protein